VVQAVAAVATVLYLAFVGWAVFVDLRRRLPWEARGFALAGFSLLFAIPPAGVGMWWILHKRLDETGSDT
jgi:hypothetical protein